MTLRNLHRWFGLAICLLMLVISVTGVLLVYKREYLLLTIPAASDVRDMRPITLATAIEAIETEHGRDNIRLIQLQPDDLALHKVRLVDKFYAWHDQRGALLQVWSGNARLEDFLLDLHHRFLLGNTVGLNIAGFSGLTMIPLLLVGLWLWRPTRRQLARGVLPADASRTSTVRSHANVGTLSLPAFLLIAITGVLAVYPVESGKILLPDLSARTHETEITDSPPIAGVAAQLAYALSRFPGSRLRWYVPPSHDYPVALVGLQQAEGWNTVGNTIVGFEDGRAVKQNDALAQPKVKRLFDFSFPLHTAQLPLWYRLLMSLFGVALAWSCYAGFGAWRKRRNSSKRSAT